TKTSTNSPPAMRRSAGVTSLLIRCLLLPNGPLLDPLRARRDDHAMNEDARRMHAVRLNRARLHQLLDFGDANLSRRRRHRIEVARGLPVLQIAETIAALRGDEREVADDPALHHVLPPLERARFFSFRDDRAVAGRRVTRLVHLSVRKTSVWGSYMLHIQQF